MEALQAASALLSLIEAAAWTAKFSQKLYVADKTAKSLRDQADGLHRLLTDIQNIVEILITHQRRHGIARQTEALEENMCKCFTSCLRSLQEINKKLEKFFAGRRSSFRARVSFVFTGEKEINRMANTIDGHLQQLHLFFTTLNGLSHAIDNARTEQQLERLERLIIFLARSDQEMATLRQFPSMGITSGSHTAPQPTYQRTRMITADSEHLVCLEDILSREDVEPHNSSRQAELAPSSNHAESRIIGIESVDSVDDDEEGGEEEEEGKEEHSHVHDKRVSQASQVSRSQLVDTPLARAVKNNNQEDVRKLLESGAALDIVDRDGWTLLHHAVARKAKAALAALLESEQGRAVDFINAHDYKKQTALMVCADKHNDSAAGRSMAKMLIDHDADVNLEDASHRTALYLVVQQTVRPDRQKFADLLVEHGGNFGMGCTGAPGCARDYQNIKPVLQHLKRVCSGASSVDPRRSSIPSPPTRRTSFVEKLMRRQSAV